MSLSIPRPILKHIISVCQFTKTQVLKYIHRASQIKHHGPTKTFPNKTIVSVFYEPSTRTYCSFQAAAIKLQCKTISIADKYSSSEKGESLEDTIKTLNYYGDAIVLRHPQKNAAIKAATVSTVPIINAGDGNGEHPTQALLDIFTIYTELLDKHRIDITSESRETITITFVGDLKNSRTIHSLIHLLALFAKVRFIYIAPPSLEMPEDITAKMSARNIEQVTNLSLQQAISKTDILYVTRIQKERFSYDLDYYSIVLSHQYKNYCVTSELMKMAKKTAIVMHPLPRTSEISQDVDNDPRAIYFTQVENGVYMRMAILEDVFSTE